jgi:hypothetical protein
MVASDTPTPNAVTAAFDWPLAYEAEQFLRDQIERLLAQHAGARRLAERMRDETGTDFYEWVDHVVVGPGGEEAMRAVGLAKALAAAPEGMTVWHHPRAMMPRVLVASAAKAGEGGRTESGPAVLAIRPESLEDFLVAQKITAPIEGAVGGRLRRALLSEENGVRLEAVERLGYRDFQLESPSVDFATKVAQVRALFHGRRRDFADDAAGFAHADAVLTAALALVPRDVACELFFAEERVFWETRNHAARVQKRRQDVLGLGWGNHDHHTFRCSRRHFGDLVNFLTRLGLEKRERFYAGDEAGWGAQVMESPAVGIVVFADVDLQPGEVDLDFAAQPLAPLPALRTVGLWCALHGDSFLQAGMHHLEARFDFGRLRDQLATEGINTMKPFSDFPFLKQAFTEGERWSVQPERIAALQAAGLVTAEQAAVFARDGAIGSHLENLQRKGGFKGFNQKAVSAIIAATDPRLQAAAH